MTTREHQLTTYLNSEFKQKICELAEKKSMSASELMRQLVVEEINSSGVSWSDEYDQ